MPRCKECRDKFEPKYFNQKYCMEKDECIKSHVEYAKKQKQKAWNKEKKVRKEKLMTRTDHLNLLQKVFNAYIRERDKELPCISCGTYNGKMSAGHYMSVGSTPELRFNEINTRKQCFRCNSELSGNLIQYRINLVELIGEDKVKFLERKDHPPLKLTEIEIKEKIKYYRKKTKELK